MIDDMITPPYMHTRHDITPYRIFISSLDILPPPLHGYDYYDTPLRHYGHSCYLLYTALISWSISWPYGHYAIILLRQGSHYGHVILRYATDAALIFTILPHAAT